jgi:hypothetical protein
LKFDLQKTIAKRDKFIQPIPMSNKFSANRKKDEDERNGDTMIKL